MIRKLFVLFCILLFCDGSCFGKSESLSVTEILDAYKQTMKKSLFQRDRWIIEVQEQKTRVEAIPETAERRFVSKYTVYRDGDRMDSRTVRTVFYDEGSGKISKTKRKQSIISDGRYFVFDCMVSEGRYPMGVNVFKNNKPRFVLNCAGTTSLALAGYMFGDLKPLADILAEESTELKMLPTMQTINEIPTYVLEADTLYGHYTVWMDPNCGYIPRRVVVDRGPKEIGDGKPISIGEHIKFVLEVLKIKKISGGFIPVGGTATNTVNFSDGSIEEYHDVCGVTSIDFNPDFKNIPDAFVLGVLNGTRVHDMDCPGALFMWQDGKVVPVDVRP